MATDFNEINSLIQSYSKEVNDNLAELFKDEANITKQEIQAKSPVGYRGRYKKGWRVSNRRSKGEARSIVYNKTDYQLTHLLENGHVIIIPYLKKRNFGKTKPQPHIKPAEEHMIERINKRIEEALK